MTKKPLMPEKILMVMVKMPIRKTIKKVMI